MKSSRIVLVSACGVVALLIIRQIPDTHIATTLANEPPPAQVGDANQTRDNKVVEIPIDAASQQKSMLPYMHAKLEHSQQVFAGLVTKDFKKIERGAEALMLTSLGTPKVKPDRKRNDEVFEHLKLEFLRLSGQLKQMASDKNLEGAAYVSEKLNATCIACHQYLRDELPRIPPAVQHAN